MKSSNQYFMLGLLLIGSLSLTACSSKKVGQQGESETAAEVAGDATAEASTDQVPAADATAAAPDTTMASGEVMPSSENANPSADAPVSDAPVAENPIADAPVSDAPVADVNPTADAVVADAAPTDSVVAPVDSTAVETPAVVEKPAKKKKRKGSQSSKTAQAATPSGPASDYQVKAGDTLMKIAFEQYGDLYRWKEIYNSNREVIQDPNNVPPGTKLTLNGAGMVTIERNGESYLIKTGDTLGVISNDVYGTARKWKKLWENNRQLIKDPNKIYAGFYLYYIPEGKLTREEVAPGLKKDDSAMNAPVVGSAERVPASQNAPQESKQAVPAENAPAKN